MLKLRKEKSFTDPAVRDVRRQLRATSEVVLLQNYKAATVRKLFIVPYAACVRRSCADSESRKDHNRACELFCSCGWMKNMIID